MVALFQAVSEARAHWATTLFLVDLGVGPTFLGHKTRVLVGWECCVTAISGFTVIFGFISKTEALTVGENLRMIRSEGEIMVLLPQTLTT